MHTIIGKTKTGTYPIYMGNNLLQQQNLVRDLVASSRLVIVTDQIIAELYLEALLASLADCAIDIVFIQAGEEHKNWESVVKIINVLAENNHDRSSTLISLGGGIIGDLTGFAAAIFMRGIKWLQIPTTLLAQVDSSIGGKTGCNYLGVKNLIGAFYQPHGVIIDIALLRTLANREYLSGLAEVIKYGMACDGDFFKWLEINMPKLLQRDPEFLALAIQRCCQLKLHLVEQDELDLGVRQALNFGHTFAHGLEAATNFNCYLHGEAVAIGMLLATRLAVTLGLVTEELLHRLYNLLNCLGLPLNWQDANCSVSGLYNFMMGDKKKHAEELRLILPCALGEVKVIHGLELKCLEELIEDYANI